MPVAITSKPAQKTPNAMYYVEELECPYEINDGILKYTAPNGRVFKREMCDEIDRIFNTIRPVLLKDRRVRFYKLIYENELVSINRYVIGHAPFTCDPEYKPVPLRDDKGEIIYKHGEPVMCGQIIRYRGEVPAFVNGEPVANPKYFSREAVQYYKSAKRKCTSEIWHGIEKFIKQSKSTKQ